MSHLFRRAIRPPVWPLLFISIMLVGASWYSFLQIVSLATSDTPLAFLVLVPILGGYLLIRDARTQPILLGEHDDFVDSLAFISLFIVCCFLIFYLPVRLSWYYWLMRLDLLAVPLFAAGMVVLFWGLEGIIILQRTLLVLFLIWPYPLMLLHRWMAPILIDINTGFGILVVKVFSLPITISMSDVVRFTTTGPENYTIIISDSCSGMTALIGFLVVGLSLMIIWSGSVWNKVLWLIVGSVFAFVSNLVRVAILLYLASTGDIHITIGIVHPILGSVLFVAVLVIMLYLARRFRFGLSCSQSVPISETLYRSVPGGFRTKAYAIALATVILACGQVGLTQFGFLSTGSLPSLAARDASLLLPELSGWNRELQDRIDVSSMFGPDSQSQILLYSSDEASMVVHMVTSPDKAALDRHTPEGCGWFHGEEIVGISTVSLGKGISARLVESRIKRSRDRAVLDTVTLYWYMPVFIGGEPRHARIALLADTEMMSGDFVTKRESTANQILQLQLALNNTFSQYSSMGSMPDFAELNSFALAFGNQLIDVITNN